jgi:ABC-type glutathione transport system ATPase component
MSAILSAEAVSKSYARSGWLRWGRTGALAVAQVDLHVDDGESLAIVGESGSGKSSLARLMLGIAAPTTGVIRYRGTALDAMSLQEHRQFRREVQPVFQDPASSLNPRMRVVTTLGHVLLRHGIAPRDGVRDVAAALLESVGLTPGSTYLDRYPHQLSGGQQQRVAIARALSIRPKLLVADEPLSSLDMSVQAQVLELLIRLRRELTLGILLISHDLNVVESIADRVAVMYRGRIVELGPTQEVMSRPRDPYTRALLEARLVADPRLARGRVRERDRTDAFTEG